jgi:hypothetical protein
MRALWHRHRARSVDNDRWRDREDEQLKKMVAAGSTPRQCAISLRRSEVGVRARARFLGIAFKPNISR